MALAAVFGPSCRLQILLILLIGVRPATPLLKSPLFTKNTTIVAPQAIMTHKLPTTLIGGADIGMPFSLTGPKQGIESRETSEVLREPVAEFLGVAILIIFGAGVDCQVVLSMNSGVVPFPRGVSPMLT